VYQLASRLLQLNLESNKCLGRKFPFGKTSAFTNFATEDLTLQVGLEPTVRQCFDNHHLSVALFFVMISSTSTLHG
jgi:hypothetical protein